MTEQLEEMDILDDSNERPPRNVANLSTGVILIALGIVLLAARVLDISLGHYLWPFYIIVPGALLFIFALTARGPVRGWQSRAASSPWLALFCSTRTLPSTGRAGPTPGRWSVPLPLDWDRSRTVR